MKAFLPLIVATCFNIVANLGFRFAMARNSGEDLYSILIEGVKDPAIWFAVMASGCLLASYLYAIRTTPLSLAYPTVTGLALVGIMLLEPHFLGSTVTLQGWLGAGFIITGVYLLSSGIS